MKTPKFHKFSPAIEKYGFKYIFAGIIYVYMQRINLQHASDINKQSGDWQRFCTIEDQNLKCP